MDKGDLSLDLFGKFLLLVIGTAAGIGIIINLLGDQPDTPEFEPGLEDYCQKLGNGTVIGETEFFNLLKSYYSGCDTPREFGMGFTLVRKDLEEFAIDQGISSDGEASVLYSESMDEGSQYFQGIIISRTSERILIREGETVKMMTNGESVVVR